MEAMEEVIYMFHTCNLTAYGANLKILVQQLIRLAMSSVHLYMQITRHCILYRMVFQVMANTTCFIHVKDLVVYGPNQ